MLKEYNLQGKVAIISGDGRGIGKGIALVLAGCLHCFLPPTHITTVGKNKIDLRIACGRCGEIGRSRILPPEYSRRCTGGVH
jgi:hypothetical protein